MQNNKKTVIQSLSKRRLPFAAFDNEGSPLHQLSEMLQNIHKDYDDTVRVKIPESPREPSESGLHRMKLAGLMRGIDSKIIEGEIDSARNLYHYFMNEFRHEMKPNLDLPPLSIHHQRLILPKQDLLITIINSAIIAEKYNDCGLNKGWDNLDNKIQKEILEETLQASADIELVKLGSFRLNQLESLITNCGGWQDGSSSRHDIWTQAEVDEAVSIVVERGDHVNLLLRLEFFLKRCYPSLTMPLWERPLKVAMMAEEDVLVELNGDCRNDYCIIRGIRGIVAITKQRPMTQADFIAQCDSSWKPYGMKLREIADIHVNPNDPPDEKLQQIRLAVTVAHQHVLQSGDPDEIELLRKLVRLMQGSGLTWEDIERKSVRT